MVLNIYTEEFTRIRNNFFLLNKKYALSEPAVIRSRVEVHLVEEAKGGPSKLLLSFLLTLLGCHTNTCQILLQSDEN
jgi:hypothetical protein